MNSVNSFSLFLAEISLQFLSMWAKEMTFCQSILMYLPIFRLEFIQNNSKFSNLFFLNLTKVGYLKYKKTFLLGPQKTEPGQHLLEIRQ